MASLLANLLHSNMEESRRRNVFHSLTLLQVLSMANCSAYMFHRIDKNDNVSMVVGFTRHFHQCSIDSECNFVVKKSQGSKFEKKHQIDDVRNYYNVWEKQKVLQGR